MIVDGIIFCNKQSAVEYKKAAIAYYNDAIIVTI